MIRKSVVLACSVERAFELFTQRAGDWWPPERRHTNDPRSAMVIEATGRFYERAADGCEVELGKVRAWEPPGLLLLDFYPGTDSAHPTEVEIRFESHANGTRVTVEHRATAASSELFPLRAPRYAASWDRVLACWSEALP